MSKKGKTADQLDHVMKSLSLQAIFTTTVHNVLLNISGFRNNKHELAKRIHDE